MNARDLGVVTPCCMGNTANQWLSESVFEAEQEVLRRFGIDLKSLHSRALLGSGTFGHVYQGSDGFGSPVAVKLFRGENANGYFLKEARAWSHIAELAEHPAIPYLCDLGLSPRGAVGYVAMELIVGESYLKWMAKPNGARLTPRDRLLVISWALSGLAHLAEHRLVHRDIKPENVIVSQGAKLVDFGLLIAMDEYKKIHAHQHLIAGTPRYVAPESCDPDRVPTPKADVYSLGIMMAESFGSVHKFQDVYDILGARGTGDSCCSQPNFHARFTIPSVVQALESLFGRMLAPDPKARIDARDACYELMRIVELLDKQVPVV